MSVLNEIIEKARRGESTEVPWYELKNIHFRDDTLQAVKQWAEENGLIASFNQTETGFDTASIHSVIFRQR